MSVVAWKKKAAERSLLIICKECRQALDILTKAHLKLHGMTKEEYISKHPEHSDIYYWGSVPSAVASRKAHVKAGGTIAWQKKREG